MKNNKPTEKMKGGMDVVERAREFAVNAHSRINHRRKYTKEPYSVHLNAVAKLVAQVTDDPATIAAAWLHDVVEDTKATINDVEREFGKEIAALVSDLTDVSKPGDGNRAVRKRIDRDHLAGAAPKAQTVKLADLIHNSEDIAKNDPRFARIFLGEMADLLDVLTKGDRDLHRRARRVHERCLEKTARHPEAAAPHEEEAGFLFRRLDKHARLLKLITKTFTARDIAEPLPSFDAEMDGGRARAAMEAEGLALAGVRRRGLVSGYLMLSDLTDSSCGEAARPFHPGQTLADESPLAQVIHVLTLHEHAFVNTLGGVAGYVTRNEINKPEFRMWLFGILTFLEMEITRLIKERHPDGSWRPLITENRLRMAEELQRERRRRGHACDLVDCLQYADKGRILLASKDLAAEMRFPSRKMARRVVHELESLRNNLAHSQDIVSHNWDAIARLAYTVEYDATLLGRG